MKTTIKLMLGALVAASTLAGCVKEEVYDYSVVRSIDYLLDGEDGKSAYGQEDGRETERYLYFYRPDGQLHAFFGCSHNITLPSGDYKLVAIHDTIWSIMKLNANLNDAVYNQRIDAKIGERVFRCSTPQNYKAGDDIKIESKTRTGIVRIAAKDLKADRSYAKIRTTFKTDVEGWHVGKGKPYFGEDPVVITKTKEVSGGIGFSEEVRLVETETVNSDVDITIEYLDADDNVLKTRNFGAGIQCLPNQTNTAEFYLNDESEDVDIKYNLVLGEEWTSSTIYPAVKVEVPDGYEYVEPDASLEAAFLAQQNDASVSEIKVFLKAGASYEISKSASLKITKACHILGQKPGYGQKAATVSVAKPFAIAGDMDRISFENVSFKAGSSNLFNVIMSNVFKVGKLSFENCEFPGFTGTIYNEMATADNQHSFGEIVLDGVKMLEMKSSSNALFKLADTKLQPMPKWTIRNCVFQGAMGKNTVIVKGLKAQTALEFTVENNVFLSSDSGAYIWFDIDAAKATGAKLTATGNLVGGNGAGGTWFKLNNVSDVTATGNTRTAGFTMTTWGVADPTESTITYDEAVNANK